MVRIPRARAMPKLPFVRLTNKPEAVGAFAWAAVLPEPTLVVYRPALGCAYPRTLTCATATPPLPPTLHPAQPQHYKVNEINENRRPLNHYNHYTWHVVKFLLTAAPFTSLPSHHHRNETDHKRHYHPHPDTNLKRTTANFSVSVGLLAILF